MSERAYIITIDARTKDDDIMAVKNYIKTSPSILNWWNYIPCVFIVISSMTIDQVCEDLKSLTHDSSFLVIEANLNNSEGWLPRQAWNWLRKHAQRLNTDTSEGALTEDAARDR